MRNRFALAKLAARLWPNKASTPPGIDRVFLASNRDQSAIETYTVCIWYCATVAVYIAALLPWQLPIALLAAIPLTAIAIEIPIYAGGGSFVLMLLLFLASVWFAMHAGTAFYVAWFTLMVFGTNAIASVVNRLCGI